MRRHHRDGGALGICKDLCLAILDVVVGALGIEIHAEPAGGIQTADLLVEVQIHFFVDDLQGASHAHHRTICLKNPTVAAKYTHARANGRLRQVHRRNVARLQLLQSGAQFPAQSRNQIAARCLRRIFRTLAAHQNDGGGESIGALSNRSNTSFCSHWPCSCNRKTCIYNCTEHGLPAGRSCAAIVRIALLVSIVNGDGNILPCILVHLLAGRKHPIFEEVLCFFNTSIMTIRGGDQFLDLRYQHSAEQFRIGILQGLPHPDIEKVR